MNELIEQMGNVYYQMYPMAYHKVITTIYTELTIGIIGIVLAIVGIVMAIREDNDVPRSTAFFVIGIIGLVMCLELPNAIYNYSNIDYYVTTTAVQMITGGTK